MTQQGINVLSPFYSFAEFIEEADRVLNLTVVGISELQGMGRLVQAMEIAKAQLRSSATEIDDQIKEAPAKTLERAKQIESDAQKEIAGGFPLVISHAAVALWAALEATIPSVVSLWLMSHPDILRGEGFEKITLPITTYESLSREDLIAEIVEEIVQSTKAPLRLGIGRFEVLLDAVGLGGGVEDSIRKDLLELSQVRNLMVHRYGVVDAKFLQICPWIETPSGRRLKLNLEDYRRYSRAVREYGASLVERIGRKSKDPITR